MTTSSGEPPSAARAPPASGGQERRRFPRHDVALAVILQRKDGDVALLTRDISRHGAFVSTGEPAPLRQLVQLRFMLPNIGEVDALCMVARSQGEASADGPGMGVDFFSLSKDAKARWERFIAELRGEPRAATSTPRAPAAPASLPRASATASGRARRDPLLDYDAELDARRPPWHPPGPPEPAARASARPPPPPPDDDELAIASHGSVFILRHPDRETLRAFVQKEVERGGVFLKTRISKELGEKVDVVLVHPETDEEFHIAGTVIRRVISGPVEHRGLGIFFRALSKEAQTSLHDFVDSGVEVIETAASPSARQLELEAAVLREPDSAEALEALGTYLLDEEGDLGGALSALARALVVGPSNVSIHAPLARAYRKIGDHVRERAHERVAEALLAFKEKMRVRMGVGADEFP
jgi:Tfp pilus assembly protein PilZ